MTKSELVQVVAEKAGLTQKDTAAAVDALVQVITDTLAAGEQVRIPGFGAFDVRHREARTGINPATKEKIEIPAKDVPVFSAGKTLKNAVK